MANKRKKNFKRIFKKSPIGGEIRIWKGIEFQSTGARIENAQLAMQIE